MQEDRRYHSVDISTTKSLSQTELLPAEKGHDATQIQIYLKYGLTLALSIIVTAFILFMFNFPSLKGLTGPPWKYKNKSQKIQEPHY